MIILRVKDGQGQARQRKRKGSSRVLLYRVRSLSLCCWCLLLLLLLLLSSLCLSGSHSLTLSHSLTHTHTHTLSLSPPLSLYLFLCPLLISALARSRLAKCGAVRYPCSTAPSLLVLGVRLHPTTIRFPSIWPYLLPDRSPVRTGREASSAQHGSPLVLLARGDHSRIDNNKTIKR